MELLKFSTQEFSGKSKQINKYKSELATQLEARVKREGGGDVGRGS